MPEPASPTSAGSPPLAPRHWPTWLLVGACVLLARLPWALQRRLGSAVGAVLALAMRGRREVAARNLALCFPELDDAARRELLRRHFRALGIGLFEFARAWWGSVAPLRRGLRIEGLEHLEEARAGGRGVILVSGHFTTLEACGRLMCDHVPLAGMYRPHGQPPLEWAVKRGRLRYAVAMFGREELRPAIRHLKAGGVLWFAPDQETRRGDSVFVPFFGVPASSLTSTHQLARLAGASVLAFAHERRDDGGYTLRLSPAFDHFPTTDATADTARVMQAIEAMARAVPAQYLWIHRRFKRQPDGVDPYA
ncbi:LpxL/LpxP family Kdo(2)-lipid IV(A) lauroyl/palmitoleoyl acyltransferase [Cognatiluteimonas lumbrici]|uniref:LpxL/LpxP family Kdo(2)-lipid IV(A) lauroyl/palmitoleoyl acyltransferase n=1 Tax=Cognatiluteimonas lumbrici TaxID=2559601 RepID=UPI0011284E85|nr:LpxL/LpxP family Kdo(2)-lipid IV(A) lauroyl/palmitoleoyl acyltransferase [Luteimonas lumbrici]